jgi:hypothetical protein
MVDSLTGDIHFFNTRGVFMPETLAGRDRAICRQLKTNPSELEKILQKTRQTIAKHIDEDRLFGIEQVFTVARAKLEDKNERMRVVYEILDHYFPEFLQFTRKRDVECTRFERYCIFGMHIHAEIILNRVFSEFVRALLADESKFVLFVCLPQKEYVQLSRWLEGYQEETGGRTASFAVLPCTLIELSAIQILAEPWSDDPRLISFNRHEMFIDDSNANRASQLATALKEYGLSAERCTLIDNNEVAQRLVSDLNRSFFSPDAVVQKAFVCVRKTTDCGTIEK